MRLPPHEHDEAIEVTPSELWESEEFVRRRTARAGLVRRARVVLLAGSPCDTVTFRTKTALRKHIEAFLERWNQNLTPFIWTKKPHLLIRPSSHSCPDLICGALVNVERVRRVQRRDAARTVEA
jgi:hypothetical protein